MSKIGWLFLIPAGLWAQSAPVLFFSDLIDGPRTGGDTSGGSQGAYVCVWGKNFGSTRGTSTISIGGVQVGRYVTWSDPTSTLPGMNISKACFQLGNAISNGAQSIVLTTTTGASNSLSFTVRPDAADAIYFVNGASGSDSNTGHWGQPFATVQRAFGVGGTKVPDSSLVYVRAGTYYPGDPLTITVAGSSAAYAGLLGYPGETVQIGDMTDVNLCSLVSDGDYFIFGNFLSRRYRGAGQLGGHGGYSRIIGIDLSGGDAGDGGHTGRANDTRAVPITDKGHVVFYGNYFHDINTIDNTGTVTGVNTGTSTFTLNYNQYTFPFASSHLPGGEAGNQIFLKTTGTAPGCSPASDVCVNGRLVTGLPLIYTRAYKFVNYTDTNPQTTQIARYTDSANTPITITDAGSGTHTFYNYPGSRSHMAYFIGTYDDVEIAWNATNNTRTAKDWHFNVEDWNECNPVCGDYRMDQPWPSAIGITPGPLLGSISGGALPARDYWVNWSYQTSQGETVASHPTLYHVAANYRLTVGSPAHTDAMVGVCNTCFGIGRFSYTISPNANGRGHACLESIQVSGGIGTVTTKITDSGGWACPTLTTSGNDVFQYETGGVGVYAPGQKFAIYGNSTLAGAYTVSSVTDGYHFTFAAPGANATYTDASLEVAHYVDWAWNVYIINAASGGGDDTDGWKQNATPVLLGSSWTEPLAGLLTSTSHPPTRLTQTGGLGVTYSMRNLRVHDNLTHDVIGHWMYAHQDTWKNESVFYNNIIYNINGNCAILVPSNVVGPRPSGTAYYWNNTCYNAAAAIQNLDDGPIYPHTAIDWTNNITWQPNGQDVPYQSPWGRYIPNPGLLFTGSHNIWYASNVTGVNTEVTSTPLTANIFLNPGLVSPTTDFHISSTASNAYANGGSVTSGRDFDGIVRPSSGRYDVGAYQFTGTVTPPTGSLIMTGIDPNWTTGTATIPAGIPYNTLTSMRWEGRVHNLTFPSGAYASVASFPGMDFLIYADGNLRVSDTVDTISTVPSVSVSGRTDFVFRAQRNLATNKLTLEVWNVDSTNYVLSSADITTAGTASWAGGTFHIGYGVAFSATLDLAYFRWYGSTVALNGQPPINTFGGNLGDWEFQGNGNDFSAGGMTLSFNSATYATTPQYNPVARVVLPGANSYITNPAQRSGIAHTLDLSQSYSLGPDASLTYNCVQLSGPTTITWTAQGTDHCAMDSGVIFGQYDIRVTVTDSVSNSSHSDVSVGVVNMDANGVVTSSDTNIDKIIGPMLGYGWSPWPYMDERHKTLVDGYASWVVANRWPEVDTAGAGTISITQGSTALTGAGTNFQTALGCSPTCSASTVLAAWYPVGATTGHAPIFISSCGSATSCTTSFAYTGPTIAGAQYSILSKSPDGLGYVYWYAQGGAYNWNGYDFVLATYAMYYRSGLTIYKTWADDMARHWLKAPHIDDGRCSTYSSCIYPRAQAMWGVILAAYLGVTDVTWQKVYDHLAGQRAYLTGTDILRDVRESSYVTIWTALAAKYGISPPAQLLTDLSNVVTNRYAATVCPTINKPGCQTGATPYKLDAYSTWNNAGGQATVTPGSNTVTFTAGVLAACQSAGYCGTNGHNYFRFCDSGSSCDSLNDQDYYTIATISGNTLTLDRNYDGTCPGGAAQCGKDWSNNIWILWGTQAFMQGFVADALWYASQALAVSDPAASKTALSLLNGAANWIATYGLETAIRGIYGARMFGTSEPPDSAIAYASGSSFQMSNGSGVNGQWFQAGEIARGLAMAYAANPTAAVKAAGDVLIGTALGRDGGPENNLGCTIQTGFSCWAMELDQILPLPTNYKARDVGFWFGVGGAYTWAAARLTIPSPTPPSITFTLSGTVRLTGNVSAK